MYVNKNHSDENDENWTPKWEETLAREKAAKLAARAAEAAAKAIQKTVQHPDVSDKGGSGPESDSNAEDEEEEDEDEDEDEDDEYESEEDEDEIRERWEDIREPVQPPPRPYIDKDYALKAGTTLRERFADSGLQIIVKMASIELTPENPSFPAGGWHVEGQINEHIIGTALYYLDSENITDPYLKFRTMTNYNEEEYWSTGQDAFKWMEEIFGVHLRSDPCIQEYGSVDTLQGRLLAFPNFFQHRVSGFRLRDPTKPGHRRFIALWLVDPYTRIISTANVPPQQAEWWAERAFAFDPPVDKDKNEDKNEDKTDASKMPPEITQLLRERGSGQGQRTEALAGDEAARVKLPPELMNMIRKEVGDWPMSREEAERHRLELMEIRSAFQDDARERWEAFTYSFCEH